MGATSDPRSPIVPVRTTGMERPDRIFPGRGLLPVARHGFGTRFAIAILQKRDEEWRSTDDSGAPIQPDGTDQALDTRELVAMAFSEEEHLGLRQNLRIWIDLRNSVAHRHLPALDHLVIPNAQAALINFENAIVREFGPAFAIAERLSVPLQLSGFRDPGVLASRKKLQASLPLDVQHLLAQPELDHPTLGSDDTFLLRVAFIPFVPSSTNSPDAIAYFAKPGEVPRCDQREHRTVPRPPQGLHSKTEHPPHRSRQGRPGANRLPLQHEPPRRGRPPTRCKTSPRRARRHRRHTPCRVDLRAQAAPLHTGMDRPPQRQAFDA